MKQFLLLWIVCCCPLLLQAQSVQPSGKELLLQAQADYQIGRVEQAIATLENFPSTDEGSMLEEVYRLLALCYLAQDNANRVNRYVGLLLKVDPYYTIRLDDPVRFADLIRANRVEKHTLVTASQQAETLDEAPVPVTLITEEMIQAIGARTLQEVLTTYVPGVFPLEGNNVNLSMRGVYTSTQENILILLNGHRLNSHSSNAISPDYRISLENIKQIEVLRGAASSLYGNVALTAVVNLITKVGKEVNGLQASYSMGNNQTYKGNLLFGQGNYNSDLLMWASLYHSQGEKFDIPWTSEDAYGYQPQAGSIYVNGYNRKPTYDLGLNYVWNQFKLTLNHRHGKRVSPYSAVITSMYDYDRYAKINGNRPGRSTASTFGVLQYANTFHNTSVDASFSVDYEHISHYVVLGDVTSSPMTVQNELYPDYVSDTVGVFYVTNWRNLTFGGEVRALQKYQWGAMTGNFLLGLQYEHFHAFDNSFQMGDHFKHIGMTVSNEDSYTWYGMGDRLYFVQNGVEQNFSAYSQIKHYLFPRLILNGGFRYDRKIRYDREKLNEFSPRLSLIYLPNDRWNVKLSYARSFVDAPFTSRTFSWHHLLPEEGLQPQHLDSWQLSSNWRYEPWHLEYDANLFYTHVTDLVQVVENLFSNGGNLRMMGLEQSLTFQFPHLWIHGNLTYQHLLNQTDYTANDTYVYSVPNFLMNWVAEQDLSPWVKQLRLHAKCSTYSKQYFKYGWSVFHGPDDWYFGRDLVRMPAYALVDVGLRYSWHWFDFQFDCKNLFDHTYRLGGSSVPILQPGRSWLGTVRFQIR
ncbi:TonB-dependent receptor [Parabacteroides distasonis]|nr:TonB-dependent receptor [Parabacteroides distasonis]